MLSGGLFPGRLDTELTVKGLRQDASQRIIVRALLLTLCVATMVLAGGARQAIGYAGIDSYTTEISTTQAGGHPNLNIDLRMDNRYYLNQEVQLNPPPGCGCQDVEDFFLHFPTGFIGNPHAVPQCSLADFGLDECSPETQVGVVYIEEVFELGEEGERYEEETGYEIGNVSPIYNLQPHPGDAGAIGAIAPIIHVPVQTDLSARTGSDYGLDAATFGLFHIFPIARLDLYLWGNPADPSHDYSRFPLPHTAQQHFCRGTIVDQVRDPGDPRRPFQFGCHGVSPSAAANVPFLENPTACGEPLSSGVDLKYYDSTIVQGQSTWPATTGCDQLSFSPSLTAQPSTSQADTPSGLDVDIRVPQPQSPSVPSPSEIRATRVTLPGGFSLNPGAADGKTACGEAELKFETEEAAECSEFSKIGTAELDSSALPGPIPGAIYIGQPQPQQRFRIFVTADGFATHVKLKGDIHLDPETGQIVTDFENLPQSPFQEFKLHFFGSERGSFATPRRCGTYPVTAEFVPWDSALATQTSNSSFTIDAGANGSPCPGDRSPFSPSFQGGTPDNTAGASSPLNLQIKRSDGDQTLSSLAIKLPTGLIQSIKGADECPESAISTLALVSHTGLEEMASSACPPSSVIGTITAGSGAGSHPLYNAGKIYLAGPYKGAPLSLEIVVPAVGGPYDLGNVATRAAVSVNPRTAQIVAVSDPLPQIVAGVPLRVRSIVASLNRPNLSLNPTSCVPKSIDAEFTGDQSAVSTSSSYFQVANCASLPFEPRLKFKFGGPTHRAANPSLTSILTARPGDSNIATANVMLPIGVELDNAHIKEPCTRVQFADSACPPSSVVGFAKADTPLLDKPLEGPVYLRSNPEHTLPDLVADLQGTIRIELVGRIDTINHRLRTSFESVPDAPVTRFALSLPGGKRGLLTNEQNLCKSQSIATVRLIGQNSTVTHENVKVASPCHGKATEHPQRHAHASRTGAGR